MPYDLTFFTNEPDAALLDRFKATLPSAQYLDILVGYFRTSGFHLLHDVLQSVEKIRILVGLSVDRQAFEIIDTYQNGQQLALGLSTAKQIKDSFADHIADEMVRSDDSYELEIGVQRFIEFLKSGKLEIKAHPSRQIHAKVYILRHGPNFPDYGRVITGSSNFSYSGLQGQYEFNVELKNRADVTYALEKFEALWVEAVDLSEQYIDTINRRTWLNDQISPYELYLKFLYEYFKEEINAADEFDPYLPDGFMDLEYQREAVVSARRILDAYNGVFLADVVGLGKTFISALLAQRLDKGHILVICPPVLKEYWEETFRDFRVPATVESLGKLEHIIHKGHDKYRYVFVDEAHRFRNEGTQRYELLHQICWGKKVILVSATPLNNRIDDIYSQLKLFQAPRKSLIPGVSDLYTFFKELKKRLNQYDDKNDPAYVQEVKAVAREVRSKVLSHVMVRRTRSEIAKYYKDDMAEQGLAFPDIADPQRIIYSFDPATEAIFNETIQLIKEFSYARYMPRLYLLSGISEFEAQSQRNVGRFMKGLLVKRLESSFFAFRNTLDRFIASYDRFLDMFDDGRILISKDLDVYDLLERDDEEEIRRLVEEGELDVFPTAAFRADFRPALVADRQVLVQIRDMWRTVNHDPKRAKFVAELKQNPLLKEKKVIVFTESAETAVYLHDHLHQHFPNQVLYFSSQGGKHGDDSLSPAIAREKIEANYDPGHNRPQDDIRILISTDVLAEGINLHRSNVVINYDLPWNPTRVLQRVGRVNRVGTEHDLIYVFNFFPTSQSDEHLGLEANIVSKIQAFHDMLGEDAKYLSDEEEVSQHDLRGQVLYRKLTQRATFVEAEEEESDLQYLQVIRRVRDEEPELFEKIKRLPKKARSAWELDADQTFVFSQKTKVSGAAQNAQLLTFFRLGRLKKFFAATVHGTQELDFFDAVDLLHCEPETARQKIPPIYYELLAQNKEAFTDNLAGEQAPKPIGGGHTNTKLALKHIRAAQKDNQKMTDEDEAYLKAARQAFEDGRIPSKASQRVMQAIRKAGKRLNGLRILAVLRAELDDGVIFTSVDDAPHLPVNGQREIILSAYLTQDR